MVGSIALLFVFVIMSLVGAGLVTLIYVLIYNSIISKRLAIKQQDNSVVFKPMMTPGKFFAIALAVLAVKNVLLIGGAAMFYISDPERKSSSASIVAGESELDELDLDEKLSADGIDGYARYVVIEDKFTYTYFISNDKEKEKKIKICCEYTGGEEYMLRSYSVNGYNTGFEMENDDEWTSDTEKAYWIICSDNIKKKPLSVDYVVEEKDGDIVELNFEINKSALK